MAFARFARDSIDQFCSVKTPIDRALILWCFNTWVKWVNSLASQVNAIDPYGFLRCAQKTICDRQCFGSVAIVLTVKTCGGVASGG